MGEHSQLTRTEFDLLLAGGAVCVLVTFASFFWAVVEHHKHYRNPPLQILCLRVLLLFPVYVVNFELVLILPNGAPLWEAFVAVYEGYAIWCFMAFMVTYSGGEQRVVEIMRKLESGVVYCSENKYRENPEKMYRLIKCAVLQLIWLRPIAIFLTGVAESLDRNVAPTRLFATFTIFWGMGWFLQLYRILHDHTKEVQATKKIVCVKAVIIVLGIQNIIIDSLVSSGTLSNSASLSDDEREARTRRVYAMVSLIEFAVVSFAVAKVYTVAMGEDAGPPSKLSNNNPSTSAQACEPPTFTKYLAQLFSLADVFTLSEREDLLLPVVERKNPAVQAPANDSGL